MINRIVDTIFFVDMLVQFFLMVEKQAPASSSKGTIWLSSPGAIAKNYLTSWFLLDLTSILVSVFDFMCFDFVSELLGGGSGDLTKLKILRVLRVLRLVKLVRLARASRMLKRLEQRFAINYAYLSLSKAVVSVVVLAHWFACIWVLQAKVQDDMSNTWIARLGYCTALAGPPGGDASYTCPVLESYMSALYFATMSITSIGYGDITPTRTNWVEQFICVILQLIACIVWAQMIGVFAGVISSFNPDQNEFRATMDELNRFIVRENFEPELSRRLRGYFHQSKHLRASQQKQQQLLSSMPPTLQGEVSWAANSTWLQNIWFLRECDPQFMLELSLQMHAVVFSPSDIAPPGYMFIIQRGVALYQGKVLTKGKVFGEDMILQDESLRSKASARAMNYLEANYVSRTELMMLANRYPATKKRIRRAAILLSLRREVVKLAQIVQEERAAKEGSSPAGAKSLKGMKAIKGIFEVIDGAKQLQAQGSGGGSTAEGGRLEGHAQDLGVQFEIVNSELADLKRAHHAQAAETHHTRRELAQLRQDSQSILRALEAMGALNPQYVGLGLGVDRIVLLMTGATTIRDVILFPLVRPDARG